MDNMTIGAKIYALRKAKGVTQADLGEYLNISYQAVSKWERDEACPDFETISRIAKYFNVPISYFEKDGISVETAVATEPTTEKEMLGVCKVCGKVVYKGEEHETDPTLICKPCYERKQRIAELKAADEKRLAAEKAAELKRIAKAREEEEQRKEERKRQELVRQENARRYAIAERRNRGFLWGGIIGGGIGVLSLLGSIKSDGIMGVLYSLIGAGWLFVFITQIFWDGAVASCFFAGGKVIGTPGVIFTFDLDGFIFLIAMKVLFAVLKFIVYLLTMLVCALGGFIIAPITFVPALLRVNRGK